jgi:hypothetical protein
MQLTKDLCNLILDVVKYSCKGVVKRWQRTKKSESAVSKTRLETFTPLQPTSEKPVAMAINESKVQRTVAEKENSAMTSNAMGNTSSLNLGFEQQKMALEMLESIVEDAKQNNSRVPNHIKELITMTAEKNELAEKAKNILLLWCLGSLELQPAAPWDGVPMGWGVKEVN